MMEDVDYIPPSLPRPTRLAKLKICEDNDAVLKLLLKRRHPRMKHVGRTHRVDLDFLHQVMADPSITARYVNTKEQLADIFTKANFSGAQWKSLRWDAVGHYDDIQRSRQTGTAEPCYHLATTKYRLTHLSNK